MESFNPRIDLQGALEHCGKQTKKLQHLVKSVKSFANQAKQQADKVDEVAGQSALHLSTHLGEILSQDDEDRTTNIQASEIQLKLKKILALSADKTSTSLQKEFPASSKRENGGSDPKLPLLPSVPPHDPGSSSDDASDTESEYFPDWSSAESFTSDRSCDSLRLGESCNGKPLWSDYFEDTFYGEEEVLRLSDEDFDDLFDDDELELCNLQHRRRLSGGNDILDKATGLDHAGHVIMPAAGNDEPGTSGANTGGVKFEVDGKSLESQGNNDDCMTPQAVRRVKSMVLFQDLEDRMAVGKRMFVLQQKRHNQGPVTSVPSPLLSSQDVTSLENTTSQTNARYRLKRSRSNISLTMTPFKRGEGVLRTTVDVIPEEDGE